MCKETEVNSMLKKSMDILDIYASTKIFNEHLRESIVDNIYGADHYWALRVRSSIGKSLLKIEPGVRIHVSKVEPEKKYLDKLTLYLRSRVRGAKISEFIQLGWERIIEIFLRTNRNYLLIAEIMPRGVFVLLDENRIILYSDRSIEMKDRVIKNGRKYIPPPGNVDKETYFNSLKERLMKGKDLVRGIVKEWGLPGYVAEEIIYRSGLINLRNFNPASLPMCDIERLIDNYLKLIDESSSMKGYVVKLEGKPQLYTCYNPLVYREYYRVEITGPGSLIDVIDSYYTMLEKLRLIEERSRLKDAEALKLKKSIDDLKKLIEEYTSKHRDYWDNYLILSRNYTIVSKIIECVNNVRENHGWDRIVEACNHIVKIEKDKGLVYVELDGKIIPLDVRLNASKNINTYMIKAGEYRSKAERALKMVKELEAKLYELEKNINVEISRETSRIKPKSWFEKYHWLITRNGLLAIGGRNAEQNESIVKKYMQPTDIFIHADIQGAPVVILKTEGREVSDGDVIDASVITVCYSKAWKAGFGYLEFYWVKGSQVSKKAPSGEYLGKGSFMIYGERSYGRCELKLAIGVEKRSDQLYGDYFKVIIGSEELVRSRSIAYAVLAPGDISVENTARYIHRFFIDKLGLNEGCIDLNEVAIRIPGPSRVLNINTIN